MHILIIDDEADIGSLVSLMLQQVGCTTAFAQTEDKALKLLHTEQFDKVLLDLQLGRTYGLDLVPKIEQLQQAAEVVIISAHIDNKLRSDPRTKHIHQIINKPFSKDELLSALEH